MRNWASAGSTRSPADPAGLIAQGNVTLDGQLGLQEPYISDSSNTSICPTVNSGSTLIQSSGTITGTFNGDSASGANLDVNDYCAPASGGTESYHDYWYHIRYTGSAVTATAIPATSLALAASSANLTIGATETYTASVTSNASNGNTPGGAVHSMGTADRLTARTRSRARCRSAPTAPHGA